MSFLGTEAAVEPRAVAEGRIAGRSENAAERQSPVFAARDGRRERTMRTVARVSVGLVVLWLVALLAGAAGLGTLPSVPLPHVGQISGAHPDTTVSPRRESGGSAPADADHAAHPAHRGNTATLSRGAARSRTNGEPSSRRPPVKGRRGATPGGRPDLPSRSHPAPTTPPASPQVAPGRSGTSRGRAHRPAAGPPKQGTGKPSANPGSEKASPSASAQEHSSRWGAGGN
jgi:hypothetical protein